MERRLSPPPNALINYTTCTIPSVVHACPSYHFNFQLPEHDNSASFDTSRPPECFTPTEGSYDCSSLGVQDDLRPVSHIAQGFACMPMFHGDTNESLDNQFDFGGLPAQSIPLDCAASDSVNPIQWPLEDQFHGQNNPAPDSFGNLNPQSLLDSDIPIPCHQFGCFATFKRDPDRIRHEAAVHGINKATYLCHVVGYNKSQGVGYTRKDKLTEHLWKKHGNLGYVKRT